jgi:PTS system nitrogen regulatory IIA component
MQISELINSGRVAVDVAAGGKKRALEILSDLLASGDHRLTRGEIFSSMINRERLGSTGIGAGVAIPHGRIEGLDRSLGAFIRLSEPVDFDATDSAPVDMMFALIVPSRCAEEHLNALAALAEMFANRDLCEALRDAPDQASIYKLLVSDPEQATRRHSA